MKLNYIIILIALISLASCELLTGFNPGKIATWHSPASSQEDLIQRINKWVFQEENCLLPCFASLRPGESTAGEIEKFVRQFDIDESTVQFNQFEDKGYNLSLFPNSEGLVTIGFTVDNNSLSHISIGISNSHDWLLRTPYNLPAIFDKYGTPDNVFVSLAGPPLSFSLVVSYREQGFMLRYAASYKNTDLVEQDERLPVCLSREIVDVQQIDLWLQSPASIESVEVNQPGLYENRETRPWWTIERASGVTAGEFANFFMMNPDECFRLPALQNFIARGYAP